MVEKSAYFRPNGQILYLSTENQNFPPGCILRDGKALKELCLSSKMQRAPPTRATRRALGGAPARVGLSPYLIRQKVALGDKFVIGSIHDPWAGRRPAKISDFSDQKNRQKCDFSDLKNLQKFCKNFCTPFPSAVFGPQKQLTVSLFFREAKKFTFGPARAQKCLRMQLFSRSEKVRSPKPDQKWSIFKNMPTLDSFSKISKKFLKIQNLAVSTLAPNLSPKATFSNHTTRKFSEGEFPGPSEARILHPLAPKWKFQKIFKNVGGVWK